MTEDVRAEIEKTRAELKANFDELRAEMWRLHARNVKLMVGCMVVCLGYFAVIYKFLG